MSIKDFVLDYLIERGADVSESNYEEFDFVKSGVIDSFEVMAFMLEIQEAYGIRLEPEDFIEKELRFTGKLVSYLEQHEG